MDGFDASSYGEGFAEVYDDWYGEVSDTEAAVARLLALAGQGPALELGVGTGRLAIPLAATGLEVVGVDASTAMLARLAAKPGGSEVLAITGDMSEVADLVGHLGPFRLVVVAFNTFFNLGTVEAQRRCLAGVAAVLHPSGRFVLEAFVPDDSADAATASVEPRRIERDRVVLTVSRRDPVAQTVTGTHVELTERGTRLRPWHLRYAGPAELDRLAAEAGLRLDRRSAGWHEQRFDEDSTVHVSEYVLGIAGRRPG